jgi:hypothetical protein
LDFDQLTIPQIILHLLFVNHLNGKRFSGILLESDSGIVDENVDSSVVVFQELAKVFDRLSVIDIQLVEFRI